MSLISNAPATDAQAATSADQLNQAALGLAGFSPANFGVVMATGIVSLAAHAQTFDRLAQWLFLMNQVMYGILWALTLLRLLRFPRSFASDLISHTRSHGFFTTVAASALLSVQCLVFQVHPAAALVLWALALLLWLVLTYVVFTALTVKQHKPALNEGLSGAWLLAVVATQSVAISSALMADGPLHAYRLPLNILALSMWLWGGMLYIWMMSLIFLRYAFFSLSPGDLTPPYWINMGAMAISTLGGAVLVTHALGAPQLTSLLPFIKGFTFFYWAAGTWWIPMLLVLSIWRHVIRRFPFSYDVLYWGAVFPLGMYSASVYWLNKAFDLGFLQPVSTVFFYVAMLAWLIVFFGLLRHLSRVVSQLRKPV